MPLNAVNSNILKHTFKQVVALTLITMSDALYLNYDSFGIAILNCSMLWIAFIS